MPDPAVLRPPPLPHEHGAWVMLAVPLLLGTAAAGGGGLASLLVWLAALLGFLGRYAAVPAAARMLEGRSMPPGFLARRAFWSILYLAASTGGIAAAILAAPKSARAGALLVAIGLLVFAAAHTGLVLVGLDRTIGGEVLGMTGLALSAPMVMTAAGLPLDGRALGAASIALAYSVSSLAFVRAYRNLATHRAAAILAASAAHIVLAALFMALWLAGWAPAGVLLALLALALRTAAGLIFPPRNLRILGMREIAVSVTFVILAAAALTLAGP